MKKCKYEDITIENMKDVMKMGYISEIICDGDNKTVYVPEEEWANLEKTIKDILKPVIEAFADVCKNVCEVVQPLANALWQLAEKMVNKKITKKKFIKLLRSDGIHRDEINKIIRNNKEPYTYLRYYNTVNDLSKK